MTVLWPNGSTTRPAISSPYGPREVTIAGASSFHRGTDFIGYRTVRSVAPGRVVAVGYQAGWSGGGYMVWIQHDGFLSRSLHMVHQSSPLSHGQVIEAGTDIGIMGNTGINGGIHHHLEIVVNGSQVDPVKFLKDRIDDAEDAEDAEDGEDGMFSDEAKKWQLEVHADAIRQISQHVSNEISKTGGIVAHQTLPLPSELPDSTEPDGTPKRRKIMDFIRYLPHFHRDLKLQAAANNEALTARVTKLEGQLLSAADHASFQADKLDEILTLLKPSS